LSARSLADSQAPMGYATTRSLERVLASCGLLTSAGLEFVSAEDVPQAGVLCARPALLSEGLLRHTRTFYALPPGFYPLESIFLYLALLALVRCRSLEQTRYQAPGEWGKLLGLDRLPEVKTLRAKIALLCAPPGRSPYGAESAKARPRNGKASWPGNGWRAPTAGIRKARVWVSSMSMDRCAFTTAH
jgi:hypothetical protein